MYLNIQDLEDMFMQIYTINKFNLRIRQLRARVGPFPKLNRKNFHRRYTNRDNLISLKYPEYPEYQYRKTSYDVNYNAQSYNVHGSHQIKPHYCGAKYCRWIVWERFDRGTNLTKSILKISDFSHLNSFFSLYICQIWLLTIL